MKLPNFHSRDHLNDTEWRAGLLGNRRVVATAAMLPRRLWF
jgi:hypothetical protein